MKKQILAFILMVSGVSHSMLHKVLPQLSGAIAAKGLGVLGRPTGGGEILSRQFDLNVSTERMETIFNEGQDEPEKIRAVSGARSGGVIQATGICLMSHSEARSMLGVKAGESGKEIKKAFNVKALKFHPDHGGDPAKFRDLISARDLLLQDNSGSAYSESYKSYDNSKNQRSYGNKENPNSYSNNSTSYQGDYSYPDVQFLLKACWAAFGVYSMASIARAMKDLINSNNNNEETLAFGNNSDVVDSNLFIINAAVFAVAVGSAMLLVKHLKTQTPRNRFLESIRSKNLVTMTVMYNENQLSNNDLVVGYRLAKEIGDPDLVHWFEQNSLAFPSAKFFTS